MEEWYGALNAVLPMQRILLASKSCRGFIRAVLAETWKSRPCMAGLLSTGPEARSLFTTIRLIPRAQCLQRPTCRMRDRGRQTTSRFSWLRWGPALFFSRFHSYCEDSPGKICPRRMNARFYEALGLPRAYARLLLVRNATCTPRPDDRDRSLAGPIPPARSPRLSKCSPVRRGYRRRLQASWPASSY